MTYKQFCERWPAKFNKPYKLQQTSCVDIVVCLYETFYWDGLHAMAAHYEIVLKNKSGHARCIAEIIAMEGRDINAALNKAEEIYKFTIEQCNKPA